MIKSITLTYQSLGSDRERRVISGPVEIKFDESVLDRGYYLKIDRISFNQTEDDYKDSNVYLQSDDVRANIELDRRPREEITSYASIRHSSGAAATNREVTDDNPIEHRMDHPGFVGRYKLTGTIGEESGLLYDTDEEDFFVVFEAPRDEELKRFASATTIWGEGNWLKDKLSGTTTVNPRYPRILEAMSYLLALPDDDFIPDSPEAAAAIMALKLRQRTDNGEGLIKYSLTLLSENNDHPSDLDTLNAGLGDCTDMTALFASMARSLNIPVREIVFNYKSFNEGEKGHAFAEVYIDGEWVHADPTMSRFDDVDSYIWLSNKRFQVETSPGVVEYDRPTTLKYSVGLISPLRTIDYLLDNDQYEVGEDYEFSLGLVLQNFAAEESTFGLGILKTGEPQAKNIRIRVVDDGGLEIDRPRLEHGTELDPGERDTAELEITVPEELAQDVVQGG